MSHPRQADIDALCKIIRGVDKRIEESVKWNAPSFSITEHFATLRINPPPMLQLVLHTGAKKLPKAKVLTIADPDGLCDWKAPDRCVIDFSESKSVSKYKKALVAILTQWIALTQ